MLVKSRMLVGLLFTGAILAVAPITPQMTSRGVELGTDQAQAQTYRRARVTARRVGRRQYRYMRRGYYYGY